MKRTLALLLALITCLFATGCDLASILPSFEIPTTTIPGDDPSPDEDVPDEELPNEEAPDGDEPVVEESEDKESEEAKSDGQESDEKEDTPPEIVEPEPSVPENVVEVKATVSTDIIDFTLESSKLTYYVSNVHANYTEPTDQPNSLYAARIGTCYVSMTFTIHNKDRGGNISFGGSFSRWNPAKWKVTYAGEEYQIYGFDLNLDKYTSVNLNHGALVDRATGKTIQKLTSGNMLIDAGETVTIRTFGIIHVDPATLNDAFMLTVEVPNSKGEYELFTYSVPEYVAAPAVEECKHDWQFKSCTEPLVCALCGESNGETPVGHVTDMTTGYCQGCDIYMHDPAYAANVVIKNCTKEEREDPHVTSFKILWACYEDIRDTICDCYICTELAGRVDPGEPFMTVVYRYSYLYDGDVMDGARVWTVHEKYSDEKGYTYPAAEAIVSYDRNQEIDIVRVFNQKTGLDLTISDLTPVPVIPFD